MHLSHRSMLWSFRVLKALVETLDQLKWRKKSATYSPEEMAVLQEGHWVTWSWQLLLFGKRNSVLHKLLVRVDSGIVRNGWNESDLSHQTNTRNDRKPKSCYFRLALSTSASGCFAMLWERDEDPHFSNPARTWSLRACWRVTMQRFTKTCNQSWILDEWQSLAESDSNAPSQGGIHQTCWSLFVGSRRPRPARMANQFVSAQKAFSQSCSHLGLHKSWCLQNAAFLWSQARKMQRARPFGTSSERTFPEVNSEQKRKFCYTVRRIHTRLPNNPIGAIATLPEKWDVLTRQRTTYQGHEQHLSRKSTRLLNHKYIQEGEEIHANNKLTFYVAGVDNVQPEQPSNHLVWQTLKLIVYTHAETCPPGLELPFAFWFLWILQRPQAKLGQETGRLFKMISNLEDKAWATFINLQKLFKLFEQSLLLAGFECTKCVTQ